jgi:hypothetical protein
MARPILVPCLIVALLAAGCADRQEVQPRADHEFADALAQPGDQTHHGTWLEEHPVVKYTAIASVVVVGVTLVATAFLAGLALAALSKGFH